MSKFTRASYRKDRALTIFQAVDATKATLLQAICQNSATGYVREADTGVLVPNHMAERVATHLRAMGWEG